MAESKHSYIDLFEGIIIGGSLAAAATFLFGTRKGKELRTELVHQYKKLGRTTKNMRHKIERAVRAHTEKKMKSEVKAKAKAVKTKPKKIVKKIKRKAAKR